MTLSLGTLGFVNSKPVSYAGPSYSRNDNHSLVITTTGREVIGAQDFKPVSEMSMELAAQFVPLLPHSVFAQIYSYGKTGSDPEIFAFDANGDVIPAWEYLPSPKQATNDIFWDGVQGEFNIKAQHCHSYTLDFTQAKLKALYKLLKAHNKDAELATSDVVKLPIRTLNLAEDQHIALGCAPSQNIYPDILPIQIPDPRGHEYRYSGCHLHYSVEHIIRPDWFPHGTIAMMDKIAGLCFTALGRGMENPLRRVAYGRPGEYRVPSEKDCRLEYRTPGSFLLHHPSLFSFGVDVGRAGYRMGLQMDGRLHSIDTEEVKQAITRCDADAAWEIIATHQDMFSQLFRTLHYNVDGTLKMLRIGAKATGLFNAPLAKNWLLVEEAGWSSHNGRRDTNFGTVVEDLE